MTLPQVPAAIAIPLDYARRRNVPAASEKSLLTDEGIIATLDALSKDDVVTCYPVGRSRCG